MSVTRRATIVVDVKDSKARFETIRKQLEEVMVRALSQSQIPANLPSVSVVSWPPYPLSKAERIAKATQMIEDGIAEAESVKEELENWRDNLPESFQEKADQLDEAISAIDEAIGNAQEGVDTLGSVEIPGAFGR